ncbi:MAG: potassium transporter TrkA [Actinomycetia bacterium]|nr:potassium transporter TrkA [Actinomycetes bacterium]MCP5031303.1 potassium transporter TrkA [Actinomycetes bacterium]
MFAVIAFLVLIALFLTTSRVAAVALESTGMARDSAQFQARSALLGVGFTTSEAEDITNHPTRRRIALWLMTFGNIGIVTFIGSFVLAFGDTETALALQRSGLLLAGMAVLLLSVHTKLANRAIESATKASLRRFTTLDTRDFAALLRFDSDYAVTEFHTDEGEWLVDRRLAELHLTEEGVVILGLHRDDGTFIGAPTGDTQIHAGDFILAYGRAPVLKELASRQVVEGDAAHEVAVGEHKAVVESQSTK